MSPYVRQTSGAQLWRCREMGAGTRRRKDTAAISNAFLLLEEAEPRGRRQACQARIKERGPSLEGPLGKGLLSSADCGELRRASDDTPPAWPGPVAAGRRGRLPH